MDRRRNLLISLLALGVLGVVLALYRALTRTADYFSVLDNVIFGLVVIFSIVGIRLKEEPNNVIDAEDSGEMDEEEDDSEDDDDKEGEGDENGKETKGTEGKEAGRKES
jgi:hypothetical protein